MFRNIWFLHKLLNVTTWNKIKAALFVSCKHHVVFLKSPIWLHLIAHTRQKLPKKMFQLFVLIIYLFIFWGGGGGSFLHLFKIYLQKYKNRAWTSSSAILLDSSCSWTCFLSFGTSYIFLYESDCHRLQWAYAHQSVRKHCPNSPQIMCYI